MKKKKPLAIELIIDGEELKKLLTIRQTGKPHELVLIPQKPIECYKLSDGSLCVVIPKTVKVKVSVRKK